MPNHGHKNWNKYAFQPTIYPQFYSKRMYVEPLTVLLLEDGHREFIKSKIAIRLSFVRVSPKMNLITIQHYNGIPT